MSVQKDSQSCRLLDDMGEKTGAQLGQVAAFIEEFQVKVCNTLWVIPHLFTTSSL